MKKFLIFLSLISLFATISFAQSVSTITRESSNDDILLFLNAKKDVINYNNLNKAVKLETAGAITLVVASPAFTIGSITMFCGILAGNETAEYVGAGIWGAGLICGIVGIAMTASGLVKEEKCKGNIFEIYNIPTKTKKKTNVSLNFGETQSGGIGLALNF